ncbi:hypothetical protein GQ473_01175 [archaeon]|nr:hypothetical protein [archaeon]
MIENKKMLFVVFGIMAVMFFSDVCNNVSGMPVVVSIDEKLYGTVDYLSYNETVVSMQEIITSFENTGSIGCMVQVRVDFFKNNTFLYTSWSDGVALEPGAHYTFKNYWFSKSILGNITGNMWVYYCDEVNRKDDINFTVVLVDENKTVNMTVTNVVADEEVILITFNSSVNLSDVKIIPAKTPIGWRIEPVDVGDLHAGVEQTVHIHYISSIKGKVTSIPFYFVTDSGEYFEFSASNAIAVVKPKRSFDFDFGKQLSFFGGVVFFIMVFLLLREKKKFRRFKNQTDKKSDAKSEIHQ